MPPIINFFYWAKNYKLVGLGLPREIVLYTSGSALTSVNSPSLIASFLPRHHTVSAAWDGEGAGRPGREEQESWNSLFEGLNFHFQQNKIISTFTELSLSKTQGTIYLFLSNQISTKLSFLKHNTCHFHFLEKYMTNHFHFLQPLFTKSWNFKGRSGPGESRGAGQRLDVAEVVKYVNVCQNIVKKIGCRFFRVRDGQARATIGQAGCQVQG